MLIIIPIIIIIGVAIYGLIEINKIKHKMKSLESQVEFTVLQVGTLQEQKQELEKELQNRPPKTQQKIYRHPQLGVFTREIKG
jgi:heme/copper-type cytochrome/quinol oxidase subunit 2